MNLALDANLSQYLAHAIDALPAAEHGRAISIPERFGPGVEDQHWIEELHREGGWAVLTQDRMLRSRPHGRRALEQSGLVVFLLAAAWAKQQYWPKAAGIIRWLPCMLRAFGQASPPALFSVPYRWAAAPLRTFKE
ncbi:MAG: hypothetical protein ACREFP_20175 [Acetobacteraceae bacterium]